MAYLSWERPNLALDSHCENPVGFPKIMPPNWTERGVFSANRFYVSISTELAMNFRSYYLACFYSESVKYLSEGVCLDVFRQTLFLFRTYQFCELMCSWSPGGVQKNISPKFTRNPKNRSSESSSFSEIFASKWKVRAGQTARSGDTFYVKFWRANTHRNVLVRVLLRSYNSGENAWNNS